MADPRDDDFTPPPTPWSSVFGEDDLAERQMLGYRPATPPSETTIRSADQIAGNVRTRRAEARRDMQVRRLKYAADGDRKQEALARAKRRINNGQPIDNETRELAYAALEDMDEAGALSSADIHAARMLETMRS